MFLQRARKKGLPAVYFVQDQIPVAVWVIEVIAILILAPPGTLTEKSRQQLSCTPRT
jgi:hypothetical protein